jgi:hypothetical protein
MKNVRSVVAAIFIMSFMACDGQNGTSCSVSDNGDGTATISCQDGTSYIVHNGEDGFDGTNGQNGGSCSVGYNADGSITITCPDGTTVTINARYPGRVRFENDGPLGGNLIKGGQNQNLLSFSVVADRDLTIKNTDLQIRVVSSGSLDVGAFIKNLKVVDLDNGVAFVGPVISAASMTKITDGQTTVYQKTLGDDYELTALSSLRLGLLVDIDEGMPEGYVLQAVIDYTGLGYIHNYSANVDVPPENIEGGNIIGAPYIITH